MANEDVTPEVQEFMESPLVIWFKGCLDGIIDHELTFDELVDGVLIYNVFLKMDIHGQSNDVSPTDDDWEKRLKNLEIIMRNMRLFYEEDSVILQEPELRLIAKAAEAYIHEVELLLILLLGCAVKCPNKEIFINKIRQLEESTQAVLANHIAKITHIPEVVLCRDMLLLETTDLDSSVKPAEQSVHTKNVYKAFDEILRINKERIQLIEREESTPIPKIPHSALELNEWKTKALQLKSMEDEYVQELLKYAEQLETVEKENKRLVIDAKAAKDYRDAYDAAMEKVMEAERLEKDVVRYREKLEQMESCKIRIEELKQDNKLLNENKDELVIQVDMYKKKIEKMSRIETEMFQMKETCEKMALENDSFKKRIAELCSANDELEQRVAAQSNVSFQSSTLRDSTESLNASFDKSICEQLSQSTNSSVLKLELENRRLSKLVETMRESSFHQSAFKILDLEKEKKSLELKNEEMAMKIKQLEENLTSTSNEKTQLQVILKNSSKSDDNRDLVSKVVTLESKNREVIRELDQTQATLNEKLASLEVSTKIIENLKNKLETQEKLKDDDMCSEASTILRIPPKTIASYNKWKSEFDNVSQERDALKSQVRDLESMLKKQYDIIEKLQKDSPTVNPTDEYNQLKSDFKKLVNEHRREWSIARELTKRQTEFEIEVRDKNVKIIDLHLENSKLNHKCDMLEHLIERSEIEKERILKYVMRVSEQHNKLVKQSLEDQENFRNVERQNNEIVNNLKRSKEKLEEKIMDQFRHMENRRELKKRSTALKSMKNTYVKMRRAGSEILGISRKSNSVDEKSSSTEKSNDDFIFTRPSDVNNNFPSTAMNKKSFSLLNDFVPEEFAFCHEKNIKNLTLERDCKISEITL